MPWALALAYRCYDMWAGVLRHYPEPGGAMEQSDILLINMNYALRTWQIDKKPSSQHTPEDVAFMRDNEVANG